MTRYAAVREPRTKRDFLDRMLSIDFSGDLRDLSPNRNIQLKREGATSLRVVFPDTDKTFVLRISMPRSEEALAKLHAKREQRANAAAKKRRKSPVIERGDGAQH